MSWSFQKAGERSNHWVTTWPWRELTFRAIIAWPTTFEHASEWNDQKGRGEAPSDGTYIGGIFIHHSTYSSNKSLQKMQNTNTCKQQQKYMDAAKHDFTACCNWAVPEITTMFQSVKYFVVHMVCRLHPFST